MNANKTFHVFLISALLPFAASATQWTGTLTAVHDKGAKTITVADELQTRTFNISTNCAFLIMNGKPGALSDLRPGEKVIINYQSVNGELLADRISEKLLECSGTVTGVVPMKGGATLELKSVLGLSGTARSFRMEGNCEVLLSDGRSGKFEDVKAGDRVSILYKPTNGGAIACRVEVSGEPLAGR